MNIPPETPPVMIYTDGACRGNPGPGGYAAVLIHNDARRELSGAFRKTTNNRMELTAAVKSLETLKFPCCVELFSDSKYLVDSMSKGWVLRWRSNSWMRNADEPVVNQDLWEQIIMLCNRHRVHFHWVKGHSSNEENIRCDELAVKAAQQENLPPDEVYELSEKKFEPDTELLF